MLQLKIQNKQLFGDMVTHFYIQTAYLIQRPRSDAQIVQHPEWNI